MIKQEGITLVEILVTLCLISLGSVLLIMLLNSGYQNINTMRSQQNAYMLAQNKLEELSALPSNQSELTSGSDQVIINFEKFKRVWMIDEKLKPVKHTSVVIDVNWFDEKNNHKSVQLTGVLPQTNSNLSGKILLPF
ncbi:MAG: hypothetical protein EP298_03765 [Gammaproteobacteria bacterium]|nr:MAG: hypothetical protein EP298_03765 [Gammaproteobacteria bacterium]UTW43747.1 hypothetical protein KFE69_06570 [bacterium SCSIO 12844]